MDELLRRLCDASAVSGNENEVREIIKEEAKRYAEVSVDKVGNVIAYKKGRIGKKKIMLASHMDEVGCIVTEIEKNGYLKFKPVGNFDKRILLAKRCVIGKDKTVGVFGIKAIHLQTPEDRKKVVDLKLMYIDVGARSKDETGIKLGDYISFATKAEEFGDNKIKAKALDSRLGVSILLELMKKEYDDDVYFCFTVQEELGARGAAVAAYTVKPDEAIVIDGVTVNDVWGINDNKSITRLGKGPIISCMDKGTLPSRTLTSNIMKSADSEGIAYQREQAIFEKNDAEKINISGSGIPTAMVLLPIRYKHTPVSVADMRNYTKTIAVVEAYINRKDKR